MYAFYRSQNHLETNPLKPLAVVESMIVADRLHRAALKDSFVVDNSLITYNTDDELVEKVITYGFRHYDIEVDLEGALFSIDQLTIAQSLAQKLLNHNRATDAKWTTWQHYDDEPIIVFSTIVLDISEQRAVAQARQQAANELVKAATKILEV